MPNAPHLSKSRFVAGLQCHKRLFWQVREPAAKELVPDAALRAVFDRGNRVGELARTYLPGGVLIDLPPFRLRERVAATSLALASGAAIVYEASFFTHDVFVAVDALVREGAGFTLIEVKSTLDVKEAHLPDLAVQLQVVRGAGLTVTRAELMHLNRACRHPDLTNLFVREDVTSRVEPLLGGYPQEIAAQLAALAGPLPEVPPGEHCFHPYDCPFLGRCWPEAPPFPVESLYHVGGAGGRALARAGYATLKDLPADFEVSGPAERQLASVREGRIVVEPGLSAALSRLVSPIAFLDFETISPAIPVWPSCHPYEQVAVQLSCHSEVEGDGSPQAPAGGLAHHAFLADGPGDPRPALARALLLACRGARTVLAYSADFERARIASLAEAVPELRGELLELHARLEDLLPIVRDHVYHPAFGGSFGLKRVLPALVRDLSYDDLDIADGQTAAALLEKLLLDEASLSPEARVALRAQLLAYCERDTQAMVRLLEALRELSRS